MPDNQDKLPFFKQESVQKSEQGKGRVSFLASRMGRFLKGGQDSPVMPALNLHSSSECNDKDQGHVKDLLRLEDISCFFGDFPANKDISLSVQKGEIHALLGENGAGKSTLMKIIYGVLKPSLGRIFWQGDLLERYTPKQARSRGIAMVFQHFSLFDSLTVLENIALAMDEKVNKADLEEKIRHFSENYALALDPQAYIQDLSAGEKQRVEIIRALLLSPKLLILDEPTSVLTPQEAEYLFVLLRRLSKEGCAILYISHKLEEIRTLCDKATILRNGQLVGTCIPKKETVNSLAEMMIGQKLHDKEIRTTVLNEKVQLNAAHSGEKKIEVKDLTTHTDRLEGTSLKQVSFSVAQGEILGIAGIAGNGQNELFYHLSGEDLSPEASMVMMKGQPVGRKGITARRRLKACFVPEERLGHASVTDFTLSKNAFLTTQQKKELSLYGLIRGGRLSRYAKDIVEKFNVKSAHGIGSEAVRLSGGNLQKFIVGRELIQNPEIAIFCQPTWGVDVASAAYIHQSIRALVQQGASVIVITQDLDEIFSLCTSVGVLFEGQLSRTYPVEQASAEMLGLLMGGAQEESVK